MTSAELWVATVVNQVVGALLLFLLTLISGYKVAQEYQTYQQFQISVQNSSFSRRRNFESGLRNSPKCERVERPVSPVSPQSVDGYHTDTDTFPGTDFSHVKPAADVRSDSGRRGSSYIKSKRAKNHEFIMILAVKIFVVCLSFFIVSVNASLSLTGVISCSTRNIVNGLFWACGKVTTLSIFVDRIGSVYRKSVYQYSVKTQRVLYSSILITQSLFISLWLFLSKSHTWNVKGHPSGQICSASTKYRLIPISALLCEMTIEIVTLKMFTSPLRKLCSLGRRMDDQTLAMAKLAQKTTVLTYVLVIVTFLTLLIIIVSGNYLANPPYLVVFCVTILLFPHWFDDWYPLLCAFPVWLSDLCCSLPDQGSDVPKQASVDSDANDNDNEHDLSFKE